MRGIGLVAHTSSVEVVVVEATGEAVTVPYRDEWKVGEDERPRWYAELRTRLTERLRTPLADFACIEDLEPMALKKGTPVKSWFKTAEVRGVLAETVFSMGVEVEYWSSGDVTRALSPAPPKGSGIKRPSAASFVANDSFWDELVKDPLPKKYREATLMVYARLKAG
jgi:hypothetical protein